MTPCDCGAGVRATAGADRHPQASPAAWKRMEKRSPPGGRLRGQGGVSGMGAFPLREGTFGGRATAPVHWTQRASASMMLPNLMLAALMAKINEFMMVGAASEYLGVSNNFLRR